MRHAHPDHEGPLGRSVELSVHDHACGIYDTRAEQYDPAAVFLTEGLSRAEQCYYVTEHHSPAEFVALLTAQGVDAEAAMARGGLHVMSGAELRDRLGGFTIHGMLSFLTQLARQAEADGFPAVRWAAEMTWLSATGIPLAEFFSFESALNDLLRETNIIGLCQYSREDFAPEVLIAAAETHPRFVFKQLVCRNHYYIPPEEFMKPTLLNLKWERMKGNIVSRELLLREFLASPASRRS